MRTETFLEKAQTIKQAYQLVNLMNKIKERHGYCVVHSYVVKTHLRQLTNSAPPKKTKKH